MDALNNKIPPPLVALITAGLIWLASQSLPLLPVPHFVALSIAAALFTLGVFISFLGWNAFRQAETTVNPLAPDTASHLVTSGIYQLTRNPMYLGLSIWLLGLCAYFASPYCLGLVVVFMLYIQRFQIAPEEKALEKIFGDEYLAYKKVVRAWL
jgi:protein-S-isoprenylcysteine O-methyltransferase Ste14